MSHRDWQDRSLRSLGMWLKQEQELLVLVNAYPMTSLFKVPSLARGRWLRLIDSSDPITWDAQDISQASEHEEPITVTRSIELDQIGVNERALTPNKMLVNDRLVNDESLLSLAGWSVVWLTTQGFS